MELKLDIDPLKLDEEWLMQATMREAWGVKLADAMYELDEAKASLSVIDAEVDQEIRDDPESYGLAKVTEAALSKAVLASRLHVDGVKKVNKARHRVEVLRAAVDGLEHKKRALTMLVELHGQEYYASPKMPQGVKGRRRERDDD